MGEMNDKIIFISVSDQQRTTPERINAQRTTHNAQRTTHNAQRTTHNAQRTTHNAQRLLLTRVFFT
jgi:hypothetical protein